MHQIYQNGNWGNIELYGKNGDNDDGPTYNKEEIALELDGKDDCLKLSKPGDFSKGFTIEFYGKFNSFMNTYTNGSIETNGLGLFCKTESIEPMETIGDRLAFRNKLV